MKQLKQNYIQNLGDTAEYLRAKGYAKSDIQILLGRLALDPLLTAGALNINQLLPKQQIEALQTIGAGVYKFVKDQEKPYPGAEIAQLLGQLVVAPHLAARGLHHDDIAESIQTDGFKMVGAAIYKIISDTAQIDNVPAILDKLGKLASKEIIRVQLERKPKPEPKPRRARARMVRALAAAEAPVAVLPVQQKTNDQIIFVPKAATPVILPLKPTGIFKPTPRTALMLSTPNKTERAVYFSTSFCTQLEKLGNEGVNTLALEDHLIRFLQSPLTAKFGIQHDRLKNSDVVSVLKWDDHAVIMREMETHRGNYILVGAVKNFDPLNINMEAVTHAANQVLAASQNSFLRELGVTGGSRAFQRQPAVGQRLGNVRTPHVCF